MKQIKYSYCLNEKKELTHISNVTIENKHNQTFYCLECGNEMIAKIGKIKIPHFAHKSETACNGESYLHKLAKTKIRKYFYYTNNFPLILIRNVSCENKNICPIYYHWNCQECNKQIPYNIKDLCDICKEEEPVENFQPDLLFTHSEYTKRKIFIEIYKTHKSEEEKIKFNYKIIETKEIKSEADIDDIIERGFIEGENCETYNINPVKLPPIEKNNNSGLDIDRFILYKNGGVRVKYISCEEINKKIDSSSMIELNICHPITPFDSSYYTGLAFLIQKSYNVKNCILCKYHKYNDFYECSICILYKKLKLNTPKPKQTTANTCQSYEINPIVMKCDTSNIYLLKDK